MPNREDLRYVRAESIASAERRVAAGSDDAFPFAILTALGRHEGLLRTFLPADDGSLAKCLAEGIEGTFVEAALRFGEHGGSLEHRLSCAFSACAIVGFVSRRIAQSQRPLPEACKHFAELTTSVYDLSGTFLLRGC